MAKLPAVSVTRPVAAVIAVVVVVALVVGVLAFTGGDGGSDDEGGPTTTVPPGVRGPTGLLVQRAANGTVVGLTVLVVDGSGQGGDVVYVPVGTMVEVASFGLVPLREAAVTGGVELLRQSIENLLGAPLEVMATVDPAAMGAAVTPAGVLTVEIPDRVESQVGERVEVVFPGGQSQVEPEQVVTLLEAGADTDLTRLVRHQAFWEAWLAEIGREPDEAAPPESALGALADLVVDVASGEVDHHLLPVESLGSEGSTGELYRVRVDELDELVGRLLPGTVVPSERTRVQVLNGAAQPGLTQAVHATLLEVGARVMLTGNADRFDYAVTQVVYYDDEDRAAAATIQSALGLGEVVKSRSSLDVVDVTIVLGADFAARPPDTTP